MIITGVADFLGGASDSTRALAGQAFEYQRQLVREKKTSQEFKLGSLALGAFAANRLSTAFSMARQPAISFMSKEAQRLAPEKHVNLKKATSELFGAQQKANILHLPASVVSKYTSQSGIESSQELTDKVVQAKIHVLKTAPALKSKEITWRAGDSKATLSSDTSVGGLFQFFHRGELPQLFKKRYQEGYSSAEKIASPDILGSEANEYIEKGLGKLKTSIGTTDDIVKYESLQKLLNNKSFSPRSLIGTIQGVRKLGYGASESFENPVINFAKDIERNVLYKNQSNIEPILSKANKFFILARKLDIAMKGIDTAKAFSDNMLTNFTFQEKISDVMSASENVERETGKERDKKLSDIITNIQINTIFDSGQSTDPRWLQQQVKKLSTNAVKIGIQSNPILDSVSTIVSNITKVKPSIKEGFTSDANLSTIAMLGLYTSPDIRSGALKVGGLEVGKYLIKNILPKILSNRNKYIIDKLLTKKSVKE